MNRLGTSLPDELKGDQKVLYDEISRICENSFGDSGSNGGPLYKRDDGAFIGPFAPLMTTPEVARHFLGLMSSLSALSGLPPGAREVAILVVGHKYKAAYEIYAHSLLAEKSGISKTEVELIIQKGICPSSLNALNKASFVFAHELAYTTGPLSDEVWKGGVEAFGVDGAKALVQYVGYYSYTCTVLNGYDVKVPDARGY